jgi:hypothetical protein
MSTSQEALEIIAQIGFRTGEENGRPRWTAADQASDSTYTHLLYAL